MQKILVLIGLSGSGKSTLAAKLVRENPNVYRNVNKDDIRAMLGAEWTARREELVVEIRDRMIEECLKAGYSPITSDTNLHPKHRRRFAELGKKYNVRVEEKFMNTDIEECIRRDAARPNPVTEEVIRKQAKDWENWKTCKIIGVPSNSSSTKEKEAKAPEEIYELEPFVRDNTLPPCIIVDIDGTIAKKSPDRGYFDWKKVRLDDPIGETIELINSVLVANPGLTVFYFSGRDEICREETEGWLEDWCLEDHNGLFMRPQGDHRDDRIIKHEMLKREIEGKYNPIYWFDDRIKVSKAIAEWGIFCVNVNQGLISY